MFNELFPCFVYVMYHMKILKPYYVFFFISEKDVFARPGEFDRLAESNTGILPFILSDWSGKKVQIIPT